MYASTSFTSQHELLVESHTRRLLFQGPIDHHSLTNPLSLIHNNSTNLYFGISETDASVVMILAVLLCALICSLALNSIIRCALRFSNVAISNGSSSSSSSNSSPQLVNKGIKKKALKTFPTVSYSTDLKLPSLDTECVICLSEFIKGEKVRILPKCNHGFHVCCIDKWLKAHSSCPKCRQCLLETCRKIVGSEAPPPMLPVPETIITIQPLNREAVERSYREESR
ncbi:RING-H2 finger protein ATL78-like [Vicia villosa]|uniref:RING-H2 finger protein ATL78-like n=1 Tax=Vicia villosa TaxID=3911 RepID=UPI00273BE800|nr:RING-H2 finger protein ATL78-like [Vicia villosa]